MSWQDNLNTDLKIVTGDGQTYTPKWKPTGKATDFNHTQFNFPGIRGTLVNRQMPEGARIPLELFYDGDDHIDNALAFEASAADPRPWTLTHPYYGQLNVQPLSFRIDNIEYNLSRIQVEVMVSITEDYPAGTTVPADKIQQDAETCNETAAGIGDVIITATSTGDNLLPPDTMPKSQSKLQAFLKKLNSLNTQFMQDLGQAQTYFNAFTQAQNAVSNLTAAPLAAIQFTQAAINAPILFAQSAQSRLQQVTGAFTALETNLLGVGASVVDMALYQGLGTCAISALCQIASTPQPGDFRTRNDVATIIASILNSYNQFLANLENISSPNWSTPVSFLPDADTLYQLNALVNFTLSQLFVIAINGQQQRTLILKEDSNWILLAHQLYGLDLADENLKLLMQQNNAGLTTLLQIPANTEIIYFI